MLRNLPARFMPMAASMGLLPFFGDIHNHCNISYGHGSLEGALARARLQLDFVSITGHAAWPDMPVDEPSVAHIVAFHVAGFARLRAGWTGHFATLREFDAPGRFTVFPGYEIHSGAHGDYTIVYADLAPHPLHLADSPAALRALLTAALGDRAFAFPHHIGYRQGARGINWDSFDPALSPFVEIFSMHGGSESSLSDRPYLHSMGPLDGAGSMQAGLAAGHRFGLVANTDHHSGFPGSYGHGRMAVYAPAHDRAALWQAMRTRRTNALTGDGIHLLARIGTALQGGSTAPAAAAMLEIEALGGGFIDTIDVIRNGRLFARISPELTPAPLTPAAADGSFDTVLYLEMGWGARGRSHLWEGDLAITGGSILSAEPRFRGAEVVSPLEGEADDAPLPRLEHDAASARFSVLAQANPNNVTPATQGFALHLRLRPDSEIHATLSGAELRIPVARLLAGALSGNLGPIDSPAWRFHMLPPPGRWQWHGQVPLGRLTPGENVYLRLRQTDGAQMAWTSPIHCDA